MNFLASKKFRLVSRNVVVFLVLSVFSLISLVPKAVAQTQANPQPTTQYSTTQTAPVSTSSADLNGQVLGCGITSPQDCLPDIAGGISGLAGAIVGALKGAIGDIIKESVKWILVTIASIFGFAIDQLAKLCNGQALVDGAFGKETAKKLIAESSGSSGFNAFVGLDYAFSGLMQAIPGNNTPSYLAGEFKNNVLGVSTANAQGEGTNDLGDGIRSVWSKMRDLAIIFMVVALVIIGFMVMLRRRLDPKTVVTATNSLPKFAIALVLIIFSFAISGFFIDLIHVTVSLVQSYFGDTLGGATFLLSKTGALGGELIWYPFFAAFSAGTIFNWGPLLCVGFIATLLAGAAAPLVTFALLVFILLVEILLRLTLFIVGIYIFWILLKNYAFMVIFTIFSPFFFLLGAVPGFGGVTGNWFKRMFATMLSFPLILFFLYLSLSLLGKANPVNQLLNGVPNAPPPLQSNILNISYLLGLGILFFATKVPKFIEKIFKIDDTDIRGGLGAGVLAAPVTVPLGAAKAAGNFGKSLSGIRDLHNNAGSWGRAASRALYRGGYDYGTPTVTPEGGVEIGPANDRSGVRAGLARFAGKMIPGVYRAGDVNPNQGASLTPEQRSNEIREAYTDHVRTGKQGPVVYRPELGNVTGDDEDRALQRGAYKPVNKTEITNDFIRTEVTNDSVPVHDTGRPPDVKVTADDDEDAH